MCEKPIELKKVIGSHRRWMQIIYPFFSAQVV